MMVRSNFAITRLILLPYGALLGLYLLVVVGGGAWLYLQIRAVQTRLVIDNINAVIEPLAEKLGSVDAVALMEKGEPWLIEHVQDLFVAIPSLRNVSVRDLNRGFEMNSDANGAVLSQAASPLPTSARRASAYSPATQRLHSSSDSIFLIRFDLTPETTPPVSLYCLAMPRNRAFCAPRA
jgi:hypothetical protein